MSEYSPRDLLLLCRSGYEINRMREYVKKHPNDNILANMYFFQLSADCLRYREALSKIGIHANNIEKININI